MWGSGRHAAQNHPVIIIKMRHDLVQRPVIGIDMIGRPSGSSKSVQRFVPELAVLPKCPSKTWPENVPKIHFDRLSTIPNGDMG